MILYRNMKYILGHKNPDTDTVCSALVYSDFLKQKGDNCQAFALGELNNETKFVFNKFRVGEIEKIDKLPQGSEIVLLDHNESGQSIENINDLDIVEIIDHHKIKLETDKPIKIYIEPLGSSCSIIAKKYFENKDVILTKQNASLLLAGIISDTLYFRSPTTTSVDKELAQKLNEIAEIEDLEEFSLEMFKAKSDLGNIDVEKLIKLDYKEFYFNDKKYTIGVMETTNPEYGFNRRDEIKQKLSEIKEKDSLAGIFFSIIDILNSKNYTLTSDEENDLIIKNAFQAEETNGFLLINNVVSRKKQIVPKLQEYFKNIKE